MQILLEVYEKMQLPMTGKETGKLFSEKRQIVEIAQKICRKKEHAVDDCGKRHGFSTRKRDKKRGKIGYTQSYPHYPQKNPQIPPLYIMWFPNRRSVEM